MTGSLRRLSLLVAIASLATLGWLSLRPVDDVRAADPAVTLWTADAAPGAPSVVKDVALPGAPAPATAWRIPDTAFLRRDFPALRQVTIVGGGVSPRDAASLRGLHIAWTRPTRAPTEPALVALAAPHTLTVGQPLAVQGRVRGLAGGGPRTLSLEGPDGAVQSVELRPGAGGDAVFSIASSATVAAGAFEWKLRLGPERVALVLGAVVSAPDMPRVLLLLASPEVEAARLQRWLAAAGARVTTRTRVSADRFRFAAANGAPAEFAAVDAALLADFDVVVTREDSLGDLAASERTALAEAIRNDGVGLLLTGGPAAANVDPRLAPWRMPAEASYTPADEPRQSRLRLVTGAEIPEPASVVAAEIARAPLQRWLVRDPQGRVLAAAQPHGRGWLIRTLVLDTWRWTQNGHAEAYAAYWSSLLSAAARPQSPPSGRWVIESDGAPLFAGEPVRLVWTGPIEATAPAARVGMRGAPNGFTIAMARDATEPGRVTAIYWPEQAGWHEVRTDDVKASLAFFVQPADALPEIRTALRHATTARLVAEAAGDGAPSTAVTESNRTNVATWAAWAVFVISAAVLWRRRALVATAS